MIPRSKCRVLEKTRLYVGLKKTLSSAYLTLKLTNRTAGLIKALTGHAHSRAFLPLTIQMSVQTVLVHPRSKWLSSFTRSGSKHDCIIPAPPPVRLDIHKIRQQSHHSQVVAAMHLGISLTALKVACRQLGVVSWTSLREQSSDTQQPAAPRATGGQGAPDDAAQAPQTQDVIYWKEEIDAKDVHEPADLRVMGEKAGICNMNIGETIKQGPANSHHQTPDVAACKQNHAVGCTLSSLSQHPAGPTPSMQAMS